MLPPTSRYTEAFSHLCHLTALTADGKLNEALDDAIVTILAIHEEFDASDLQVVLEALEGYFGLPTSLDELSDSVARLKEQGRIRPLPTGGYRLDGSAQQTTRDRIAASQALDTRVEADCFKDLEGILPSGCDSRVRRD